MTLAMHGYIIMLGLLLGIIRVAILLEHDADIQQLAYQQLVEVFKNVYHARLYAGSIRLSLFKQAIVLEDVEVTPLQGVEWRWFAQQMNLHTSILDGIVAKVFPIDVELLKVKAHSSHTESLGIVDHLKHLAGADTGYPIGLRSLNLEQTHFEADFAHQFSYQTDLSAQGKFQSSDIQLDLVIENGCLLYAHQKIMHDINGQLNGILYKNKLDKSNCTLTLNGWPLIGVDKASPFHLSSSWQNNKGLTTIRLDEMQTNIRTTFNPHEVSVAIETNLPLKSFQSFLPPASKTHLEGLLTNNIILKWTDVLEIDGFFSLSNARYNNHTLGSIFGSYAYRNGHWLAETDFKWANEKLYQATLRYDQNKKTFTIVNRPTDQLNEYMLYCQLADNFIPKHIRVMHNANPLIEINQSGDAMMEGTASYQMIQPLIEYYTGVAVPGSGTLYISGQVKKGKIFIMGGLKDGLIHIPSFFNFFTACKFSLGVDVIKQIICLEEAQLIFEKGSIECSKGIIRGNSFVPVFMYIPCVLKNVFCNIGKQIFVIASGHIDLMRTNNHSHIDGLLSLERGYVRRNLFSSDVQHTFIKSLVPCLNEKTIDSSLSINVITKNPVQVKTSFLTAAVVANMKVSGTVYQPSISGELTIKNGQLLFPYKPLTITQGHIYFMPHQLDDPLFELVAKGKARTYQIIMRCQGSLKDPQVTFDSSPSLSQEQIITLLLAGSSQGTLSLVMPALIMQHLNTVLFGPEQSQSRLERYFKNLLAPLRHIRFVPSFADQKARGGVRGAFEIEVNDQLRALIQKNFSLTEDTRLEVEYAVTDDVSIRGIRDERGDLGGEVELRWKF